MSAQLLAVLLAFTSLCAASEPDCEELVKPLQLDTHSPIFGKWVLHVSSWDKPGLKSDLVAANSSWIELSPSSQSGSISLYWADRLNDNKCLQGSADVTVSGMTSHTTFNINNHTSYHEGKYYATCSDCLLSEDTTLLPDGKSKGRYLFLFSMSFFKCVIAYYCRKESTPKAVFLLMPFKARTGKLEPSELETFKKQAVCLNFPPEFYFLDSDLCPDDRKTGAISEGEEPTGSAK